MCLFLLSFDDTKVLLFKRSLKLFSLSLLCFLRDDLGVLICFFFGFFLSTNGIRQRNEMRFLFKKIILITCKICEWIEEEKANYSNGFRLELKLMWKKNRICKLLNFS